MISDVLSEAISAIRKYQRTMPHVYKEMKEEIDEVVKKMDQLRDILDTPPMSRKKVH